MIIIERNILLQNVAPERDKMAQSVLDPQDEKYTRELPIATTEILALFKSNEVVTSIPFRLSGGD